MNHSAGSLKLLLPIATVAIAFFSASPIVAQDAFHVTFGTTGEPGSRYADGAGFVVETDSGDIVVAGTGATYGSDDGIGNRTYPLIARFDSRGALEWQRVYTQLENQRFTAVLSAGEEQYVTLREDPDLRERDRPRPISLRRVSPVGDISESLGELGGYQRLDAFPVTGGEPYFLVVAVSAARGAPALEVKLLRFDLRANVTEQGSPAGIGYLVSLQHAGGGQLLFPRWREREPAGVGGRPSIETEIVRMRLTGEMDVVATVPDKLCRFIASSLNRVFCVAYPPPGPEEPDVLIAYSMAGQELWRHDLPPGVQHVGRIQALESGELVYSYGRDMDAVVNRLSAPGDLLWVRRLRSTGPYTFLAGIKPLRDGRLALFGSTGPLGEYVSTDTNAMLVVTDVADGDVSAKIASIVVASP